ncbi:MAG: type I-D CRISPR-associated protein Cas7/Csc2 [Chloroflexi bacterium]|nr:MAG: type I-D CRISPR-associated protein Cas7/Csc2 [Chloroflexota bacterium]PIE81439.1 MAG: type I-D CRISPR-associated protein Cas7/Csc2 [Chloroflexota bacterium]
MNSLEKYTNQFLPTYSNYPQGHYVTLILARWIESEAIFRTEGSGEPLSKEFVLPGLSDGEPVQRVVISKRKQTAVERRTGRELLRRHDLLHSTKEGICALNRNNPCEKCMDCMIYGYAAGGGGAQKARVITDDAFSLHPVHQILGTKQFNALFDNSTMRDPETGKASSSIGTDEYVKPQSVFLDMETLKDLTLGEFQYVLGNVLRSTRYGAVSSRIGKVNNELLGVVFSDCELFSNLELTQAVYDILLGNAAELDFPLAKNTVHTAVQQAASNLMGRVVGQTTVLSGAEVTQLVEDMIGLYGDETAVTNLLQQTNTIYYSPQ